ILCRSGPLLPCRTARCDGASHGRPPLEDANEPDRHPATPPGECGPERRSSPSERLVTELIVRSVHDLRPSTRHAWAATAYAALAVAFTWPLALTLPDVVPHDPGDPLLSTWALWWNARV